MRHYLVVGHRTLGGAHLLEHLHQLRTTDPYCRFHVLVPEQLGVGWAEHEIRAEAQVRLDEMLDRLASMGMGATGEVGASDPLQAIARVIIRSGKDQFTAIVLSTLPQGLSQWWDVPSAVREAFPDLPLTHLVAEVAATAR
jgi:hypothetical protein